MRFDSVVAIISFSRLLDVTMTNVDIKTNATIKIYQKNNMNTNDRNQTTISPLKDDECLIGLY